MTMRSTRGLVYLQVLGFATLPQSLARSSISAGRPRLEHPGHELLAVDPRVWIADAGEDLMGQSDAPVHHTWRGKHRIWPATIGSAAFVQDS